MRSKVSTSPLGWRSIRTVKLLNGAPPTNVDRAAFIFQIPEVPSRPCPKKSAESSVDTSKQRMASSSAHLITRRGCVPRATDTVSITVKFHGSAAQRDINRHIAQQADELRRSGRRIYSSIGRYRLLRIGSNHRGWLDTLLNCITG